MSDETSDLDERSQHLLRMLVERYIRDGHPIGSRTLSRESGLGLSSATIRNVMFDLESLGFLHSPHTSAGRIPTQQGYRVFIDTLLTIKPLGIPTIQEVKKQLNPDLDAGALVKSASNILSEVTRLAGIVMVPKRDECLMRHIEFLPLSDHRILVIFVANEKEVQNHIINTDRKYSEVELQQTANYINEHFAGRNLQSIISTLKAELKETQSEFHNLMECVVKMAGDIMEKASNNEDLVIDGQTNLMGFEDLSDLDKLKQLFEAFNKKRDILHLLDRCQQTESMQIYIGQESGYDVLKECSIVTAPYSTEGEVVGVLGVIGPTRMAYDKVIPLVDVTAKLLGAALSPKVPS